jgi:DNA-binding transcriptional regulator YiaG
MRPAPFTPERLTHLKEQGAAIAWARHQAGLTQRQVAAMFSTTVNTVAKWEGGQRSCPPEVRRRIVAEWGGDAELLGPGADKCSCCGRTW